MICPIVELIVKPFQRQEDTTWYPIQITLYTNQTLLLRYQYSDFIQYSKLLHQEFQYLKKQQLVKLHKKYFYSKSHKYMERQTEIESFCRQLLALPMAVQCSNTFLAFFIQKQETTKPPSKLKRSFSIHGKKKPEPLVVSEPIKFKIIYDMNNMIVIRVSRSITLQQLKSKVIQKFSLLNIDMTDALTLRVINNYQRYSISSCSSAEDSIVEFDPIIQADLEDEQDFYKAMHDKWHQTQKVILKCIP